MRTRRRRREEGEADEAEAKSDGLRKRENKAQQANDASMGILST